ncbi:MULTISPECIES: DNA helicase Rep [Chromohalobacter]|uniref:ATP-dependent DNA helicase Rep n=1 Tax=Chromohalobacter israelensis (strain ATCC BAA-138 / DSM 3043 / CIP 106854 / NCIMB 13768 / 1H11) TaxID=290398 RepID=Q1QSL3_CHRI1|nr:MULTISPECIES: DNA helicase Rep [Chromohalobacter]ABE60545.1 ATP-dependent DNA helicase Rep [Chromohalobacter salexigens DSM 3043]MDF9435409.1 DNA helicase Rep [Chromohalobacter israelensis]NWO55212.1 DNA helicase Rep [Chromohalobacter salexigens]PWW33857.1 ATP-dependent DNA helicase Rep [Chromohalobacter salexigens]RXE49565.1 DNA helicase Rep [Chromohalobacter salexigens]
MSTSPSIRQRLAKLNPRQQEAARYIDGPCLVLAGAGSGKTSVITTKIAYLIQECGMSARKIAAVTFTNKAAREMKERVGEMLQGREGHGLTVSTFHTLGLNIIRGELKTLGYKPGFSLFDPEDAKALLRDLMQKEADTDAEQINAVQGQISQWKNDLVLPGQAISHAADEDTQYAARVYEAYSRHLKAYNAVDFDDLILLPVVLLRDNPDALARWRRKIQYMLVDEYQDTNVSQYQLVKLLMAERATFTVVGDDDQSIYAWRGARPENLVTLGEDFPRLNVIKLEQNYRSTGTILRAANTLIGNNPHVYEKTLWSEMGQGDAIRVIVNRHEEAEAERVASEILTRRIKERAEWRDFAVLYRGNFQARLLELKLQHYQIPYKLSGGTSFFSRNEIKDAMAYLRLLINPGDDNAFLRIVNVPRREVGPGTLEKLANYATERQVSLFAACHEIGLEQVLPTRAVERLSRFTHFIDGVRRRMDQGDAIAAIRDMLREMDYEAWLFQNASAPTIAERRMANVWTLIDQLEKSMQRDDDDADETDDVESAISRLVLRDILEQQAEEDDSDRVQLLTMHASKGLEFPHVYLMGLEEELLPHRNAIEAGTIEEERRLAYVGITRARRTLTLTLARQRKAYGELLDCTPSRFLEELPPDDLEWEGRADKEDPEKKQARGKDAIAGLRSLLG